jgi:type IV secretion system protein VirD4
MREGARVGVAVGVVAAADAAVMPLLDALGHMLRQFPHPPDWRAAAAATLAGRSWLGEALHLVAARPAWWVAGQVPWAVAAGLVAYSAAWAARRAGEPRAAASATHGSARWRRPHEMRETLQAVDCAAPAAAGVVVGSDGRRAWLTRPDAGNPHVLLLGTPGSGKSRRVILPTIWALGHAQDSMVVSDPKGELYQHAAAWLRGRGYDVVLVDLVEPRRGNRWNPLEAVRRGVRAGDLAEASARAWEVAHTLAVGAAGPLGGEGRFWQEAGESLLAALVLAVAAEAPDGQANPATMLRVLLALGADGGALLDAWMQSLGLDHPAALAYANTRMAAGAEKARASIYMTAATHLRLFADPGIAWLTAESDHSPVALGLGERPMAVFLCVPDEAEARQPLVSLYVSQAYAALVAAARDKPGGALPRAVWFVLDEFGNIGRLADIRSKVTAARSRRVRFLFALQNLEQLQGLYGKDDAATVVGNCDTLVYLSTNSNETAQAISARIGHYTVRTTSVSTKPTLGGVVQGTESAAGRPLLAPDEVMRLAPGAALVLQARQHAARLPLADLSRWQEASRALVPGGLPEARQVEPVAGWLPDVEALAEAGEAGAAPDQGARPEAGGSGAAARFGGRRSRAGGPQ